MSSSVLADTGETHKSAECNQVFVMIFSLAVRFLATGLWTKLHATAVPD